MDVKIAPSKDEISVDDRSLSTKWNGGITYFRCLKKFRELCGDDYLKECFQEAIALSSYKYQVKQLLDLHFLNVCEHLDIDISETLIEDLNEEV